MKPGEKLFLYVHGVKTLHGVYRALTPPFKEAQPEKGPWKGRAEDEKHGWYPFRIQVEPMQPYQEPLSLGEVEHLGVELNDDVFRARPSVVYIRDESATKLELALDKKNERIPTKKACLEKYPSQPTQHFDVDSARGSQEEKLTLKIQTEIEKLESGIQALQAFYPLRAISGRNVWIDILARDLANNYVVVELKTKELQESIWNQVFHYAWILRSRMGEGTKVRSIVICHDAEPKLAQAYRELKMQLREPNFLKVYRYYLEPPEFGFRELSE